MRGKQASRGRRQHWRGNIPAYAGKTRTIGIIFTPKQEHPRVCGENDIRPRKLMRNHRNIPAYAGKTSAGYSLPWVKKEHPRVCGENVILSKVCHFPYGTSPRMRGKLAYLVK